MNAGSFTLLSRLISMGSGSLLQYVSESAPWSADSAHAAFDAVAKIAREERDVITDFTRLFQKKHLRLPLMASFPSHFTNINFCALDYLLPKLIAEHQKEIAEIESKLHLADDEEIRALAAGYLDMKRRHLQTLTELAAGTAVPGAA